MSAPFPWQEAQWRQVARWLARDRVPHGLLFGGPAGTGKGHFARALAAWLLCRSPAPGGACGTCRACLLWAAGTHPDFLHLGPEKPDSPIRIDAVRELGEFAQLSPSLGGRRVAVLEPAEAMTDAAANALLKTLEEPPAGVHLLLLAHHPARLPATVRSRCPALHFPVPSLEVARAWLLGEGGEPAAVERALAAAGGRPLRARALLAGEAGTQLARFQQVLERFEAGAMGLAEAARELAALDLQGSLEWLQYRALALARRRASARRSFPALAAFFAALAAARRQVAAVSLNRELLWEAILLHWREVVDCAEEPAAAPRRSRP